jgi:hypothetical protein
MNRGPLVGREAIADVVVAGIGIVGRLIAEQVLDVEVRAAKPDSRTSGAMQGYGGRPPMGRWLVDLFVEPRLIGNLDVVSVRVADVCREVVGTPFGPKARFLV